MRFYCCCCFSNRNCSILCVFVSLVRITFVSWSKLINVRDKVSLSLVAFVLFFEINNNNKKKTSDEHFENEIILLT